MKIIFKKNVRDYTASKLFSPSEASIPMGGSDLATNSGITVGILKKKPRRDYF